MSKKTTYIHSENNNKILSSNEVRLSFPPEPEKMKVLIWGKELCNMAEWNDFLKCIEEKTEENNQLKQQLAEKQNIIEEINKEIVQAVHDWKALCAEKDKEIEKLKFFEKAYYYNQLQASQEDIQKFQQLANQSAININYIAIQELEKAKDTIKHFCNIHNDEYYGVKSQVKGIEQDVCEQIDQQIKGLKGE